MKRIALFVLFSTVGTAILLYFAGGIEGPRLDHVTPEVETLGTVPAPSGGHSIPIDGRDISDLKGILQTAPPERIVWKDRLSDEQIVIPIFFPWRFNADDLVGTRPADADRQGAVCHNVLFRTYREPLTRAEAVALRDNEKSAYDALLNQTFEAGEAQIFGRLGEALNRKKSRRDETGLGDTKLILSRNVHIVDKGQGLDIRGEPDTEVTVWPEQGRADGRGPFVMSHEAFTLTGDGLAMEHEKELGWSRVKILRNPVLRIHSDIHDADGKPVFDFGGGDFKPTHVISRGGAILKREVNRRETVITITFTERVSAEQQGGRSLDAGRVEIIAVQPTVPGAASSGWRLRHFLAEENVKVEYPGHTKKGEAYLAAITADRLVHDVPSEGLAMTELEGDVVMVMRGEIPLLGPNGRMRASCRDRAWIGPHRPGSPTGGHDPALLQQIGLRGEARIERTEHGVEITEDRIEGDAIDLVVLPKNTERGVGSPESSGMIAIHFAALGDVRLGGTRIRGTTHRLIGDRLDTDRPHILAEGKGTRFSFPNLGHGQRLLGPDPQAAPAPASGAAPGAPVEPEAEEGKWFLQRLLATGMVDIATSLGGPALGIPAQVSGDELSYSRVSQQTQVIGRGGRQARIAWTAPGGEVSHLETRILTLDQALGRLTAVGGVTGEFYVARDGGGVSPFNSRSAVPPQPGVAGPTLSIHTDGRIDIELVRNAATGRPKIGGEQIIRIAGPLTADLRAADRTVDRLRAESLELALVYGVPEEESAGAPMAPTARAGGGHASTSRTPTAPAQRKPLERIDLTAGEIRLDIAEGEARYIEATQNVEMSSKEGRVTGQRLTYQGLRRHVEVLADAGDWRKRPAVAWLGTGEERMEIRARRLALTLDRDDNRPARLEAEAPSNAPAVIQLYRRSDSPSPLSGPRNPSATDKTPRKRSGAGLEWFTLTYWGTARMDDSAVTIGGAQRGARRLVPQRGNQNVRVVRRMRARGQQAWGAPTALWTPSLRVVGRNMLAADGAVRDVQRIIAEGPETTMRSGQGADLVKVWGHRFEFDVRKSEATLSGRRGRSVRFQRGDPVQVDSEQELIIIDMNTNLPSYVAGSRILWKPPRPQPLRQPRQPSPSKNR